MGYAARGVIFNRPTLQGGSLLLLLKGRGVESSVRFLAQRGEETFVIFILASSLRHTFALDASVSVFNKQGKGGWCGAVVTIAPALEAQKKPLPSQAATVRDGDGLIKNGGRTPPSLLV
jgi:hypothetical protein